MPPRADETGPDIGFLSRIRAHLDHWGLRSYPSETAYYDRQRQVISPGRLQRLADLAQKRQGDDGLQWDLAFYDLAASPDILPVLYSQRFGYYEQVGLAIVRELAKFPSAVSVLDVGCGVGILTTWYASVFPDAQFLGVDRSPQSIAAAERQAARQNLSNARFICCSFPHDTVCGRYDVIIATQVLLQSEVDPGLPSQSWMTFARGQDGAAQRAAEERTGLGPRLDGLLPRLTPRGVLLLFEKTSHLGRRVLLQRALMRRGFALLQKPQYLDYVNLGEPEREGPLYVASREPVSKVEWDEMPQTAAMQGLYRCAGRTAHFIYSRMDPVDQDEIRFMTSHGQSMSGVVGRITGGLTLGCLKEGSSIRGVIVGGAGDEEMIRALLINLKDHASTSDSFEQLCADIWPDHNDSDPLELVPLYENHSPGAQRVWADLAGRQATKSESFEEKDGRARHIEIGECLGGWVYLYWANTYDQRQLVMMDAARKPALLDYYEESVQTQT